MPAPRTGNRHLADAVMLLGQVQRAVTAAQNTPDCPVSGEALERLREATLDYQRRLRRIESVVRREAA